MSAVDHRKRAVLFSGVILLLERRIILGKSREEVSIARRRCN
jgi:hypothetical protein